jgi:hypothetical protein
MTDGANIALYRTVARAPPNPQTPRSATATPAADAAAGDAIFAGAHDNPRALDRRTADHGEPARKPRRRCQPRLSFIGRSR